MSDDIPPLKRPEDMAPIRSQADLLQHWRALMGELGFTQRQLWIALMDAEARWTPLVQKVEDLPHIPDPQVMGNLMTLCRGILSEVIPDGSFAFLVARPGAAGITASDRAWAAGLSAAARKHGVACHPVHLANDHEIRAFTPDDEIASA